MNHDIFQPVPQGSDGAQDAENSRIAAIADELERLCTVHEAQLGTSQADVILPYNHLSIYGLPSSTFKPR